ncbi:hypothetical protein [Usitatibacter palustris]|nr:hypothetical protein [Usitatibacter palustris]
MTKSTNAREGARSAEEAADLLVTVAETLNERLAVTAGELARSQDVLRDASNELMAAFRGAADRMVAAQRLPQGDAATPTEYGMVLDHLYSAVEHLQSHDLVNQLIDAQKLRVDKMRGKLVEALELASMPVSDPASPELWIERSRAMLDCIVAGIAEMDKEARAPMGDKKRAGSVDLF